MGDNGVGQQLASQVARLSSCTKCFAVLEADGGARAACRRLGLLLSELRPRAFEPKLISSRAPCPSSPL